MLVLFSVKGPMKNINFFYPWNCLKPPYHHTYNKGLKSSMTSAGIVSSLILPP